MDTKIFELMKELQADLQLVTELFLLKYDKKISSDDELLSIFLSAYFTQIFNMLGKFEKLNKNLEKNMNEFETKIIGALKEILFLTVTVEKFEEINNDEANQTMVLSS